MSYHNVRDKFGRFSKKSVTTSVPRKSRAKKLEQVITKKTILNFFLLDNTGSMQSKIDGTIEGFNQILIDGRLTAKQNNIHNIDVLAKFGGLHDFKVQPNVAELTKANYYPNAGSTALWQAIIKAIEYINAHDYKQDKTILTIFTDGEDNVYYGEHDARELVKEHQAKDWVINFVGAGTKTQIERASAKVGIFASNTLSYTNTSAGTKVAMKSFSQARTAYTSAVADGVDSNIGFFSNE